MPWLEKGREKPSENLLFVHIPRCGGTSLMKSHDVPKKATKGMALHRRFFMRVFFRRYELLEQNNFPIWTETNAACLFIFIIGCFLLQIRDMDYKALSTAMIAGSTIVSGSMTYVFVAPTICRVRFVRRLYLLFVEYVICRAMANVEYITGTNWHGYLPHLTARKMIDYGYVTKERVQEVSSLAIIRNPYARMVSIYMYNRFGPWESFSHFVRSWYGCTARDYREGGKKEEWYTPCHAIPQFEYTHDANGTKRLVRSVVKQEELKYLKQISSGAAVAHRKSVGGSGVTIATKMSDDCDDDDDGCDEYRNGDSGSDNNNDDDTNSICSRSSSMSSFDVCSSEELAGLDDFASIRGLPDIIRTALLGMPHDNKRKTKTPWYDYYDQETLNLTYQMYHRDFEVFDYSVVLEQRPDLEMPPSVVKKDAPV